MRFLFICAFGAPQREVALFFRIGHSTVSSVFHEVIDPMRELHLAYVKQPDDNDVSLEVELNPKHQAFPAVLVLLMELILPLLFLRPIEISSEI